MEPTDPLAAIRARADVLARAEPAPLKAAAEAALEGLPDIEVLKNATGLVMLPMRDTAEGVAFHLGEVLVAESHIRGGRAEGYGMRLGHDLEAAMAMAVLDLALALDPKAEAGAFVAEEAARQAEADRARLCAVEATRVKMETF